jgi:hypothetical protein
MLHLTKEVPEKMFWFLWHLKNGPSIILESARNVCHIYSSGQMQTLNYTEMAEFTGRLIRLCLKYQYLKILTKSGSTLL